MNELFAISPEAPTVRPAEKPAAQPTDPAVLRALAEVERDSQDHPETYLRDTVVPHGGE